MSEPLSWDVIIQGVNIFGNTKGPSKKSYLGFH